MKFTIAEIYNAAGPLGTLSKVKLPVKVSLSVVRLIKKVDEHLIPAQECEQGLITHYGKPLEEGPNKGKLAVKRGDENYSKFSEELGELMLQEVEIVFDKVQLPEALEIEPGVLMALEKFIRVV